MLASIVPFGERARHRSWAVTATAYVAGCLVGGGLLGAAAGLAGRAMVGLGALPPRPVPLVVAAACLVGAAVDVLAARRPLPGARRQVNEDWLNRYRGWVCGVGFGVQLGLGVVTIVTSATVYLVFVLSLLSASALAGAVLGAAFGLARGVPILLMARVETPDRLRAKHRRLEAWRPHARRAAVGVQCAAAGIAVAVAVGL